MKKALSLLLALMFVFSLAACAPADDEGTTDPGTTDPGTTDPGTTDPGTTEPDPEPEANSGGTIIIRESGDPMSFVPSEAADDFAYGIVQNMFNRLTKLDASKSPIPDAAESWDVSDDGLTITWHLKDNMKWHDGEALDGEDVKYTFDYIKANETCYFSSSMSIVDSIEVVDPLTVVFNMNQADMSFIARIGWYATFIMPEHIFNNGQAWADNAAAKDPIGSGPFKFESYEQGVGTTLVANPDYHDAAPLVDKLIFSIIPDDATAYQALLNGEIDILGSIPFANTDEALSNPDLRVDQNVYPSPYRIIFNVNDPILSDLAVRQAISYCIDREDISEKAYAGIMPPEYSAYPSIVEWAANTEDVYPDIDIAMASQILEDAGYTKDADGFYVTGIEWEVFEGMQDFANLIIAKCAEAGIDIKMNLSEFNAWAEKVGPDGNYMMESQGGFMGPDPAALYNRLGTDQSGNYAGWSNAEFDALCIEAAAEPDTAKRAELYKQAQALIIEELPAINVVGYAAYEAAAGTLKNLPIEGAGKWGWNEYTYAYFDN